MSIASVVVVGSADGDFGELTATVEAITGRKPTAIDEFIGEHRDFWLA